jgi:hypothetical protein
MGFRVKGLVLIVWNYGFLLGFKNLRSLIVFLFTAEVHDVYTLNDES